LTYRELKRLDSVTRSPIYALLGESVDGAAVIRAFSAQEMLFVRLTAMLNKQQHAYFLTCAAQSWLAVRLELIGTLIVTFACASAVLRHMTAGGDAYFAGLAGLAISYSLSATQSLNWSVRMASDMEASMVAVERIKEYTQLDSEGDRTTPADVELLSLWPSSGEIDFQDVKLRYRPELPFVLKGLTLRIPGGSKVGVVGRTGAGKSTLMVALMRIVELSEGKVRIDGIDSRSVGLSKLRSSIAVIPQDPVLFSGTVRTNLDPFDEHTDKSLLDALEQVGLFKKKATSDSSKSLTSMSNCRVDSLDNVITENGTNFSVGQRQLIVIARALLRGTKIVIMDEATASIDAETDAIIQSVLRSAFANSTCITVAHRLNTIMDSDLILVMNDGKVAEFDSPIILLEKGGMFRDLVQAASH
jgi:ABC-type multidrug transport system fused ATPase/permease subunit